jgi:hypothetical protein
MKMRDAEVRTDLQRQKILGPQESKRLDREQKGEVERQKEEGRMQRSQQSAIGKERHSLRQSGVPEKDLPKAVEKYYPAQAPQTQPLTTLPTGQKARMITLPNGQKAYVTQ